MSAHWEDSQFRKISCISTVMSVTKFSIGALENAAGCEIRPSHVVSRVTLVELNKATSITLSQSQS